MKKINTIEKSTDTNPKIVTKFLQFLSHEDPYTDIEINVTKKEYFDGLMDEYITFVQSPITMESVLRMFHVFSSIEIVLDENIINNYQQVIASDKLDVAVEFLCGLIKSQSFLDQTYSMAKLLFNKAINEMGFSPLVFYPQATKKIVGQIEEGMLDSVETMIYYLYMRTQNHLNQQWVVKTQEEVVSILLEHEMLLKSVYGITSLGLYGSYVNGEQHMYSDIDIWVASEVFIDRNTKIALRTFLHLVLNLFVDLSIKTLTNIELYSDGITVF